MLPAGPGCLQRPQHVAGSEIGGIAAAELRVDAWRKFGAGEGAFRIQTVFRPKAARHDNAVAGDRLFVLCARHDHGFDLPAALDAKRPGLPPHRHAEEQARAEIEDRYGHAPVAVANAFAVMHLRILADRQGISKVDGNGGRLAVSFRDRDQVPPRVFSILSRMKRDAYVSRDSYIWPYAEDPIRASEHMLDALAAARQEYEDAKAELGF